MPPNDLLRRVIGAVVWSGVCLVGYFATLFLLRVCLDAEGRYAAEWGLLLTGWFLPVCVVSAIVSQCLESIGSHSSRIWASIGAIGIGLGAGGMLGHGLALGGFGSALRVLTHGRSDWIAWTVVVAVGFALSARELRVMKYGDQTIVTGINPWLLAIPMALLYGAPTSPAPTASIFAWSRGLLLWLVSNGDRPDQ